VAILSFHLIVTIKIIHLRVFYKFVYKTSLIISTEISSQVIADIFVPSSISAASIIDVRITLPVSFIKQFGDPFLFIICHSVDSDKINIKTPIL
jgi:hypothetical protein